MLKKEAINILSKVNFEGKVEPSVSVNLARSGKKVRYSLISTDGNHEKKSHAAAIEISRIWRGYRCRKNLQKLFTKKEPSREILPSSSSKEKNVHSILVSSSEISENKQLSHSTVSEKITPDHHMTLTESDPSQHSTLEKGEAEKASSYVKEQEETQTLSQEQGETLSSSQDQEELQTSSQDQEKLQTSSQDQEETQTSSQEQLPANVSSETVSQPIKQNASPRYLNKSHAATAIQKAWRRHIDMQVFRYYRDLINFRRQGNPSLMLRCINPAEAKLLDAAAGVHVKFRLAGEKFPPNIYYKIYTHRPVADLCSYSPKDYTKAPAKQPLPIQIHTKDQLVHEVGNKKGWYRRFENNGWRLVSDRLIHAAFDKTTWETSQKEIEFHYSKLKRRADVEKKRRKKKISWMYKMYKQGLLQAKHEDEETKNLVQAAADGLVNTVDLHGSDAVMDWEVDELLQWTTALNFDDYLEGWKETATSNISEQELEELNLLNKFSKTDPPITIPFDSFSVYRESSAGAVPKVQNNFPMHSISNSSQYKTNPVAEK